MEKLELDMAFWRGKRVLLTGHTGFKGSWLAVWLAQKGARVFGYALPPTDVPNMYSQINVEDFCEDSMLDDLRNRGSLGAVYKSAQPDLIIHMAAQAIVKEAFRNTYATYETNIMGTVSLLEVMRADNFQCPCLVITTDKVYRNKEWYYPYRECDQLGGADPYSASKSCVELIVDSYAKSFSSAGIRIATARAGNVIGGGDWSLWRLVPDFYRSRRSKQAVQIRYPTATRPWQHVLDPLSGYLELGRRLVEFGQEFAGGWNFGPSQESVVSVMSVIQRLNELNAEVEVRFAVEDREHESITLALDSSLAKSRLNWKPLLDLNESIEWTNSWMINWEGGGCPISLTLGQLAEYEKRQKIRSI